MQISLDLQLPLHVSLLSMGKMNYFTVFVIECTKEFKNWALGRKFVIENISVFGEIRKLYDSYCIQVIQCFGYDTLDFIFELETLWIQCLSLTYL